MKKMILSALMLLMMTQVVYAERIKDLASIAGVRSNQLAGYGLVIGLDGSGDKTEYATQSLKSMLARYGVALPAGVNPTSKNIAAVMVHADLPPFSKIGQSIDVTVSSLGNAKSLRGGSLIMTPLKGLDGQIYAIAQGNLIVGGFGIQGSDGSKVTVNVPSVGRIPNGASVERAVNNPFATMKKLQINLNRPDFTTAKRLTDVINRTLGPNTAHSLDASSIEVTAPKTLSQRVSFVSYLENLEFKPGQAPARVIINSRTGTVVIGNKVRVYPAAVSHGSLTVTIANTTEVSQPNPLSSGTTETTQNSDVEVTQEGSSMFLFPKGISLNQIVRAVNNVGAAPGDLVAILEALKEAGALAAELVVI